MAVFNYKNFIDKNRCVMPPEDFSSFVIENIVTINKKMKEIVRLAARVARTEARYLLRDHQG